MLGYGRVLTSHLKRFDPDLFTVRQWNTERDENGNIIGYVPRLDVVRKSVGYELHEFDLNGVRINLISSRPEQQYVFTVSDNWSIKGKFREWGIDFILNKLRESDFWSREADIFRELEELERKSEETKRKDFRNMNEAFLSDAHSEFKRTFKDVNVSNIKGRDKEKMKQRERKLKWV